MAGMLDLCCIEVPLTQIEHFHSVLALDPRGLFTVWSRKYLGIPRFGFRSVRYDYSPEGICMKYQPHGICQIGQVCVFVSRIFGNLMRPGMPRTGCHWNWLRWPRSESLHQGKSIVILLNRMRFSTAKYRVATRIG